MWFGQLVAGQTIGIQTVLFYTETAVACAYNHIGRASDAGQITQILLFDLTAAFDTVHRSILLDVLSLRFGVTDRVLSCFSPTSPAEHSSFFYQFSEVASIVFSVP